MKKNSDQNKIEISVIMGVYNIENLDFFSQAMKSILHQSYKNFEVIICDDGSTDNTFEVLRNWAAKDIRIKIIKNNGNQGLAAALNHCLKISQGQFIARQDADDISQINRLELQIQYLNANRNISFVGSNLILLDKNGEWGKRNFPEVPVAEDFLFTLPFIHGSLMFRREQILNAGYYRVAKETRRTEDYDLLMRMYSMGMQGANLQEYLYKFLEDQSTIKRRKYRFRIDEMLVRYKGFRTLGLLPKGLPFVVKPLVVGLIPSNILRILKKKSKRNY